MKYNPLPYLPERFQKIINSLKSKKIHPKIVFFTLGILSTLWFLIRVIPKPSRANYPCMQATAPFMASFVIYITSLGGSVLAFKAIKENWVKSRYFLASIFVILAISLFFISQSQFQFHSFAQQKQIQENYFTPNAPIGEAVGIFPGRVVWMWNPGATNENCTNTSNNNGVIDSGDDAWFMEANNNATVIDSMITKSILSLTGETQHAQAWDQVFRFFNENHGFGNVGYSSGEKIVIKINATTVYGAVGGRFYEDLGRNDDLAVNPFSSETNPYVVYSVLHQLVDIAGVPEEMIYIGDPARNIYKEFYELWHADYPNVNYLGNDILHPELDLAALGRTPVAITTDDKVFWSDEGTVMPEAVTDKLFSIYEEAHYLINIPTMKAHATGGITLAAKNHFGSFTRDWALHLHNGLMAGADDPTRLGYGLYRVQTDIMEHELLGGNTLLFLVDGLYPGEDALGVPEKWEMPPFNGDWCSSIFMSLDPVAIESVCHDFLRTEYNGPTIAESRPNWFGVDDYLHQAADSALWPEGIVYDPDNNGILMASLGVHEHWNDSLNKEYTRNLEIGDGIELIKVHEQVIGISELNDPLHFQVYPNPASDFVMLSNIENQPFEFSISDLNGKKVFQGKIEAKSEIKIELSTFANGTYLLNLQNGENNQSIKFIKN